MFEGIFCPSFVKANKATTLIIRGQNNKEEEKRGKEEREFQALSVDCIYAFGCLLKVICGRIELPSC